MQTLTPTTPRQPARPLALAAILLTVMVAAGVPARAAAPTVDFLYPAGGRQGTTVTVSVGAAARGDAKIAPWPAKAWTDCPGLTFEPGKDNGTFTATIAKDAPPGPHLVRVYNDDGSAAPRVFVVGRHAEEQEDAKPPSDGGGTPRVARQLPAVLNGRLEKQGEADAWAVDAEAGRWLVAELECRRLGSPIDPALQLLDPDGNLVAFGHDAFGLDPLVAYRAPRSGRYTLQIGGFVHPPAAQVRFAGSPATVYRLNVTTGPYARHALPAVASRAGKTPVRLFGWNLPDDGLAVEVEPPAAAGAGNEVTVTGAGVDNAFRLPLAASRGVPEAEPNDAADAAQGVAAPAAIDGRLGRPGDVDRFAVRMKKGDRLAAAARAHAVGSPLDPVLTVTGPDSGQVARDDDGGTGGRGAGGGSGRRDPQLEWAAAADGTYVVSLQDLTGGGGPGCVYRLDLATPAPAFAATADAHSVRLEPGKSADVKVTVTRTAGHDKPLAIEVAGLPDGVTAEAKEVPAKGGAATVTLKAASGAKPANAPFRIRVVDGVGTGGGTGGGSDERLVTFALEPGLLVTGTDALWLTVVGGGAASRPAKSPAGK